MQYSFYPFVTHSGFGQFCHDIYHQFNAVSAAGAVVRIVLAILFERSFSITTTGSKPFSRSNTRFEVLSTQ